MNRGMVTGSSIAASTMAVLAFFHGYGPAPPSPASAPSRPVATVEFVGANEETKPTRVAQKEILAGPWNASQAHFAGMHKTECPASFEKKVTAQAIANLDVGKKRLDQTTVRAEFWCIPKCEEVKALIAILPDPAQTKMQLQFDRMIDGLQLAAESAGYVIDRYWLPWEAPPVVEYTDYASRKAVLQEQQEKQKQPGLLLFRWNGHVNDHRSTLFVFIVSDASTTGINGEQFKNALSYVRQVCGDGQRKTCAHDPITIIGPTFSGSLASLRHLADHHNHEKFDVYSGTVSSACAAWNQGLRSLPPRTGCPTIPDGAVPPEAGLAANAQAKNLHFTSLVQDTETAVPALKLWLQGIREIEGIRTDGHCDLAIFTEAGTTYGSAASQQPEAEHSTTNREDEGDLPCPVTFEYPREISSLRNAYLGQESARASSQASRDTGLNFLPFNLADRGGNRNDEPPDFSTAQGPLSKEAVVASVAAELKRQHIKVAGVIGSNVLDVLFLASFLRKACPDIRLFVLNADLLFERELDNRPYIGTLTLTTYPLILRNLDWLHKARPRLSFVDQYQEGEYNAALYAISGLFPGSYHEAVRNETRELGYPFEPSSTRPFKLGQSELPLWLTAVGYGGYWPVTLLTSGGVSSGDPELRYEDFSIAWKTLAGIVCILGIFHFLGLLINCWPIDVFPLSSPAPERRFFFVNVASATVGTALAMLIAPLVRFGVTGWFRTLLLTFTGGLIVLLFWRCGVLQLRLLRRTQTDLPTRWLNLKLTAANLAVWLVASIGVRYWLNLYDDDPSHYGFFFAYRSVHVATGVSPFAPIIPLLAAVYCWALFESRRLTFLDEVRPRLCQRYTFRTKNLPGGLTEDSVAKSVNDFRLRRNYRCALWIIFALWWLSLPFWHPFQIFEQRSYGVLCELAFGLGVLLMLSSGLRLGQIWSDLKELLAELDQSRIKPAFDAVREQSWIPIWHSGVTERAWTNIERCMELMEHVVGSKSKLPQDIDHELQQLTESVNKELIRNQRERRKKLPNRNIQEALQNLVQWAMRRLPGYWSTDGASNPEESNDENRRKNIVVYATPPKLVDAYTCRLKRLEQFVALRYVAFIGGVLYQIRLLIINVATVFTLILLSLNFYSFEPHQSLIWSFTAMFAVIGFLIVKVLWQAHRDDVLSHVTGTKANEPGLDFYLRVALFGVGPLATLLATHFPAIGRFVASFLQPGLEALK